MINHPLVDNSKIVYYENGTIKGYKSDLGGMHILSSEKRIIEIVEKREREKIARESRRKLIKNNDTYEAIVVSFSLGEADLEEIQDTLKIDRIPNKEDIKKYFIDRGVGDATEIIANAQIVLKKK